MSSSSSSKEESSKKSKKEEDKSIKSKPDISEPESQAGTSKLVQNDRKKSKKNKNKDTGFFPQNMLFWKQEEPAEVQLTNWSNTSQDSIKNKSIEPQSKQSLRNTESLYIWPDSINIQESQRLANQPTLDQIIEQKKLRENQLVFADDFNKDVDYLGDRISKTKLNIVIAQLNKILPTTSQENMGSIKKLTKAKPLQMKKSSSYELHRKASKASEHLSLEEIAQKEKLRQNQLKEYENLRDQMDVSEARSSYTKFNTLNTTLKENSGHAMEETLSKTDLNKLIDLLNKTSSVSKDIKNTQLQEQIQSKPQIVEVIRQVHKKAAESLTSEETARQKQLEQNQMQEFENLREEKSTPIDLTTTDITKAKINTNVKEETKVNKIVTQLNESNSLQNQEPLILVRRKTSKIAESLPEEIKRRERLRQKQIDEYENLREQIGLFGERKSDVTLQERKEIFLEGSVSKQELNLFICHLNEEPHYFKKRPKAFPPSKSS